MGEHTGIQWAHHTFNPWEGCTKVSPGCVNCYAEARDRWLHQGQHWGPGSFRKLHKDAYWQQPLKWQKAAAAAGEQRRVFCGSLMDILEPGELLDQMRARVFDLVPQTPNLLWLFLSKRPENAADLIPKDWQGCWPGNVMLGITAENQEWLDRRMEALQRQFGRLPRQGFGNWIRIFVSAEPLLEEIYIGEWANWIEWVICGGESGENARPMKPHWARSLRYQCARWEIKFFFKQHGEWCCWDQLSEDARGELDAAGEVPWEGVQPVGKRVSGRLLDGREWNEIPEVWPVL
jgi:protein gp37